MDYDQINKTSWLEKITKDLRGKSIEACYQAIEENFRLDPFAGLEDLGGIQYHNISKIEDSWLIGCRFGEDQDPSNADFINYLSKGAEAISFKVSSRLSINQLYDNVYPSFIYNHIILTEENQIAELAGVFAQKEHKSPIKGFLNLGFSLEEFSIFSHFHLHEIREEKTESIVESLVDLCTKLIAYLESGKGLTELRIVINLNDYTLRNIIKIRTVKLLIRNLCAHFRIPISSGFICVDGNHHLQKLDGSIQLIGAANLATSAVIAGVDQLNLFDHDPNSDYCRLGLNVQHLLKTEARLNLLDDPLAGAFAIEKACSELGSLVWEKL